MSKPVFKTAARRQPKKAPLHRLKVAAGEFVFEEGELGREMYVVHEGQVEILRGRGDEEIQLAVMEKGDFFGEMAILEDLPRNASARALDDVVLVRINGAQFDGMLRQNPEIAVRIMRKLSRRLRQADGLLRETLKTRVSAASAGDAVSTTQETAIAKGKERLLHVKSGMAFHLSGGTETSIGRSDPVTGISPDIDLTPVDHQRSCSRRHSRIYRKDGHFFIMEEIGTMNGTFVNDVRVESGVPVDVHPGDQLRIGLVDLKFVSE